MFARNDIDHDDLISILFTATDDIHSMFPADGRPQRSVSATCRSSAPARSTSRAARLGASE